MGKEYRVVWKRHDCLRKTKKYSRINHAKAFIDLLHGNHAASSRLYGIKSDYYTDGRYDDMPKLEYVKLEQREVGRWEENLS